MKICWDNLEGLRYSKRTGKWYKGRNNDTYVYQESCKNCGNPFLAIESYIKNGNGLFCNNKCSSTGINNGMYGKTSPMYGKKHTEESKKKMSKSAYKRDKKIGSNSSYWKGGVTEMDIPLYDTYAHQIKWCEEVRRSKKNENILEVKCTYCGKWFIPIRTSVKHRIQVLKGNQIGEQRLYCSNECKVKCSMYGKTAESLMKLDAVMAGRDPWWELPREVQPELRQIVLERDGYQCIKCGSTEDLHCHHIEGINHNPIMSADMDICITVCKKCHKEIHKEKGCTYSDMKC